MSRPPPQRLREGALGERKCGERGDALTGASGTRRRSSDLRRRTVHPGSPRRRRSGCRCVGLRTSSASASAIANADPIPTATPRPPEPFLCAHRAPPCSRAAVAAADWQRREWRRGLQRGPMGRSPLAAGGGAADWAVPVGGGAPAQFTMATVTRPPRRARRVRCRCPSPPSLPPGGGRACSAREPRKQRSGLTSGAEPAPPARPQRRRPHRAWPGLGTEQGGRTRNRCSDTPSPSDSRPLCHLPASAWLPRRQNVRPTAGRKGVCVSLLPQPQRWALFTAVSRSPAQVEAPPRTSCGSNTSLRAPWLCCCCSASPTGAARFCGAPRALDPQPDPGATSPLVMQVFHHTCAATSTVVSNFVCTGRAMHGAKRSVQGYWGKVRIQ